jgi:hypothetical protein
MNPREKKERDLSGHCKNRYGNNDKAARKGVRRKKRVTTHRARREGDHTITQISSAHDPDEVESSTLPPPLGGNSKWPDTPIRQVLHHKIERRIQMLLPRWDEASDVIDAFIDAFCKWCEATREFLPVHVSAWGRYLRALSACGNFPAPKITAQDQRDLHAALIEFAKTQLNQSEPVGGGNSAALRASP